MPAIDDERVAIELDQPGREHRPQEVPHRGAQRVLAARQRVAWPAPMHSLPSALARHPAGVEHECGRPAGAEVGDPAQRAGVAQHALELGVDDRVDPAGLSSGAVADGMPALDVGPAGAVGDHLRVPRGK
jgi:hypothetical protein